MKQATSIGLFAICSLLGLQAAAQDYPVDDAAVAAAREALVERMVMRHGFERDRIAAILDSAVIDQSVLRAISRPAERVVPWYEYRGIFLNDARIGAGVRFWQDNADLVERTAAERGVDPEMILAIVGIESLFGERMGRYRVLDSLSTLAFAYPPRASFFASELEAFLVMSSEEGPDFLGALGSYAGAMGAGQFIPTSYSAYAVDGDGDGHRDLWRNWSDILASVANYFAEHGWEQGGPVAVPAVRAPDFTGPEPDNSLELATTVGELHAAGYRFESPLPDDAPAMVKAFEADAGATEYWVGFHNFRVITRYNRSVKYALAAHELSLAIRAAHEAQRNQPL
jgi:membrane-bound lytic murein transglycosylase B